MSKRFLVAIIFAAVVSSAPVDTHDGLLDDAFELDSIDSTAASHRQLKGGSSRRRRRQPTAAPTTAPPSTPSPTAALTTASPTTTSPTTASPTTASPTTASPTTASPTTASPTTASPTTATPTSAAAVDACTNRKDGITTDEPGGRGTPGVPFQTCSLVVDRPDGSGSDERWYELALPEGHAATATYPAFVWLHGGGIEEEMDDGHPAGDIMTVINGVAFEKDFGDGYVVATPHSAVESSGRHRWMWQDGDDRTDYQFLEDLVAHLVQNYGVDPKRVFAGGHSSGGIILYSFVSGGPTNSPAFSTSVVSPIFRAFSPSGANQMAGAVDTTAVSGYSSTPKVSVLHLHGGDDTTQHWQVEGGPPQGAMPGDEVTSRVFPDRCSGSGPTLSCTDGYDADTIFYTDRPNQFWLPTSSEATPETSSVGAWAAAAGCAVAPAVSTVDDSCLIERHSYSGCPTGVEAHAIRYDGVGHTVSGWDTRMQFFERFCADELCAVGQRCGAGGACEDVVDFEDFASKCNAEVAGHTGA